MTPSLPRFPQAPAQPVAAALSVADADVRLLKRGIWAYFLLLIFEGALRKWILPGLAAPLLIVRDPIALWLLLLAWRRGLLPANAYLAGMTAVGVISFFTALLVGHGNLYVAIYGSRILLLHFPLVFVIGRIFNRTDVERIGRAMLWIAIPMTVLIALQFYSPQSAWVNRGVGGDVEGAGFSGALDFFRPPGTFSFTNGTTHFYTLLACFVFYFWLTPRSVNRLLLTAATAGLLASVPFSISRTLLFQVIITMFFAMLAVSRRPRYLSRMLSAVVAGIVVVALLSQTSLLKDPIEAFTTRIEMASDVEGGAKGTLGDRYLGEMAKAIMGTSMAPAPFFGYGIGMGTNVASNLLSGDRGFLVSEEEWGRVIGEQGLALGLAVILIRLGLTAKIAWASYRQLAEGLFLPWLLVSLGLLTIPQGQWAQPTSLGFSTLLAGLMIASLRTPHAAPASPQAPLQPPS